MSLAKTWAKHSSLVSIQRLVPRSNKSIGSKINREKSLALIKRGQMKAARLEAVDLAKSNGRWEGATRLGVPLCRVIFRLRSMPIHGPRPSSLDSRNRYAVPFPIQTAKKTETRSKRNHPHAEMLDRNEKLCLAKLLRQFSGEFEPLFAEFEPNRRPRAARISAEAHKNEVRQKVELGPFGCLLRDQMLSVVLPLLGARSLDWMYSYRMDWNEPIRARSDRTGWLMPGATAG